MVQARMRETRELKWVRTRKTIPDSLGAVRGPDAARTRTARGGFSLLEVVLSLAILGGSMAVLGEAVRLAMENARVARDLTDAQLYCESKMAELEAGILTTDPVTDAQIEPMMDSSLESGGLSQDTGWLYSIETEVVDDQGLVLVYLSVYQDPATVKKPVTFTMSRMFLDESMISTDSSTTESTDTMASEEEGTSS
ncbi:MAG: prepilin-type N-terminal cleavage/methylation domain-containing protein [Thermoguttaceae bacterium]